MKTETLPIRKRGKYHFDELKVGQAIVTFDLDEYKAIANAAYQYQTRHPILAFSCRAELQENRTYKFIIQRVK